MTAFRTAIRTAIAAVVVVVLAGALWFMVGQSRSAVAPAGDTAPKSTAPEARGGEGAALALTPEQRQRHGLKVEPVQMRAPEIRLAVTGKIAPNANRTVAIMPRGPGRVVQVNVQLGDTVQAGATLALVDSVEAASALAELAQSESALALADAEYERAKRLVERKIGAGKDLMRAEAAVAQARAQRDKLRDQLRLFGFTDATLADAKQRPPGHRVVVPLVAPFRGTVIERQVAEGQLLDAAAVPFRLADLSVVWALLDVPEADVASVAVGQHAVIETAGATAIKHSGRIIHVGDIVEEQTRTVKIRVEVPNHERHFKPGMFVTARITTGAMGSTMVMIRKDAVVLLEEGPVVFVEDGARFRVRAVDVSPEMDGWLPVRQGLQAGERIVTAGTFILKAQLVKARMGED